MVFKADVSLLLRQLSKMFPEAPFFVLPFGGDKPLPISAFYVWKNVFFHVSALSDFYLHLKHTNACVCRTQTAPRKARMKNSTEITAYLFH